MTGVICPFCESLATDRICAICGRPTNAPRRPCPRCQKMSPLGEPKCCHCQYAFTSDLSWKIPLIIAIFIVALILAIVIQVVGR